jgi:DnaJ family protein C protein 28
LVEDLIAESMAKGEFDNLPGQGRPLQYSDYNPYVDSMTHNLNKVLINNGYTPPWISLGKEIRYWLFFVH